jgi:osomolarity two-component system response regulator SKN7
MPKMDGISATRSIRQYDALTPIISMTSNFTDNDIMQYIGSGMTDILPKPFSKRTLYQMLEKYCAHLKTIQRVTGLDPSTSLLNPSPLDGFGLLPPPPASSNGESSSTAQAQQQQQHTATNNTSSPSMTPPQPLHRRPPPPYSSISQLPQTNGNSSNSSTTTTTTTNTTTTPTAFPLAPYPYPVTMNLVPTGGDFNHVTNEIPNITFWPQQQPQQQDPPPAIIPNDGKFTWAVPANTNQQQQQVFDPVAVALNESNKRHRME